MPRPTKPPRLYLRERDGRDPVWVILDSGNERSLGVGKGGQREAEAAFAKYLADKHVPQWGDGDPARVPIADVLSLYVTEHAVTVADPTTVSYRIDRLLEFFGTMMCWDVTKSTCAAYVKARAAGLAERKPVTVETARGELEALRAALNYAYKARKISKPVFVDLPEKSPARQRWLSHDEALQLVGAAYGYVATEFDRKRSPTKWKRVAAPQHHLARFLIISLYTGSRMDSVLQMRWGVNSSGGWFDLEQGILYRKAEGEADSKKRRTPAPIPDTLKRYLRRWKLNTKHGPCEFKGKLRKSLRTAFATACDRAGLGEDVNRHTLKHTAITWMLQAGHPIDRVAAFTGTSEETIRHTYRHHAKDYLTEFRGHSLGKPRREIA